MLKLTCKSTAPRILWGQTSICNYHTIAYSFYHRSLFDSIETATFIVACRKWPTRFMVRYLVHGPDQGHALRLLSLCLCPVGSSDGPAHWTLFRSSRSCATTWPRLRLHLQMRQRQQKQRYLVQRTWTMKEIRLHARINRILAGKKSAVRK